MQVDFINTPHITYSPNIQLNFNNAIISADGSLYHTIPAINSSSELNLFLKLTLIRVFIFLIDCYTLR